MIPVALSQTTGYILVGIVTAVVTGFVGWLAYRANKGSAANAFTANLLARLDAVEDQLEELRGQLSLSQRATIAAVRFIDRLADWGRAGGRSPMPVPSPELHEYLDPTMWQQAQTGPDA